MNRAKDLKITLPFNIKANQDYSDLEFVLLDYSSTDDLVPWIKRYMMKHIESGKLVYYYLPDREYYDMCESRNIALRLATGDIVNNLDADNFTADGIPNDRSFARWLSENAVRKTIFVKSKQLSIIHGRLGFWKDELFDLLGGYDEDLKGYGHDDQDLIERALELGFTLTKFGGRFFYRIETREKDINLRRPWDETRRENKIISGEKIRRGEYKAKPGKTVTVTKNFREEVTI